MFISHLDDFIALVGLVCLITGMYLWLGIPAALILLGIILIYIGWRVPERVSNEPDKTANTTITQI